MSSAAVKTFSPSAPSAASRSAGNHGSPGAACAEFSGEGHNDADTAWGWGWGWGWVAIGTVGRLVGRIYIHNSDDSGFVCEPH